MKLTIIRTGAEFTAIEDQWNDLLANSDANYVFNSHLWLSCWLNHFTDSNGILIVLVHDGNKLIAAAPLAIRRGRIRFVSVRELSFLENDETGRSDMIFRRDVDVDSVTEAIFERVLNESRSKWDIVKLRNIPKKSKTPKAIARILSRKRLLCGINTSTRAPYLIIDTKWDDFLNSKTKHFRKKIRSTINKVKSSGKAVVIKVKTFEEFESNLDSLRQISANSWLAEAGLDMFSNKQRESFFIELTRNASKCSSFNIWMLKIDDVPIAFEYHLRYLDSVHALRACYSHQYENISPGFYLECNILKQQFSKVEQQPVIYDLCSGEQLYKKRWTFKSQEHLSMLAFRKNLKGVLLYNLEFIVIRMLRERIKHNLRLNTLFNKLFFKLPFTKTNLPYCLKDSCIEKNRSIDASIDSAKTHMIENYGLNAKEAELLLSSEGLHNYYTQCCACGKNPKRIAVWVINELLGNLKRKGLSIETNPVAPGEFAELIDKIEEGVITGALAKNALKTKIESGQDLHAVITELLRGQKQPDFSLESTIEKVIGENSALVQKYAEGQSNVLNYFVGAIMKSTNGCFDPADVKKELQGKLETVATEQHS